MTQQSCVHCSLKGDRVFCSLEKDALDALDKEKTSNIYTRGQTLFLEGNPSSGLYCINSGKVKVTKLGSDGRETIIRIATSGDLLGHRSLFSGDPYSASATVLEDSDVCYIIKNAILSLIKKHPSFSFKVIHYLSRQMGAAEKRLASLCQKDTRAKFSELLLLLNETYGVLENGKVRLNIYLTREEMASMIGVASENLIRLVTEFKNLNLIQQEGKAIYLLNIPKIKAYALLQ